MFTIGVTPITQGGSMAEIARYILSITVIDGVNRESVIQYYVKSADAKAYMAAADTAARNATNLGVLINNVEALTLAGTMKWAISGEFLQDDPRPIADDVLRGNKLLFHLASGGRGLISTIPARDPTAYTQDADSLSIGLAAGDDVNTWVTQVNAYVVDAFGNSVVVTGGEIVD